MLVKNGEVVEALRAVRILSEQKMPFGAAMAVRKLLRELSAVVDDVEAERLKLVQRYAVVGEDGQPVVEGNRYLFGEKQSEFNAGYGDLLAAEVEVSAPPLHSKGMEHVEVEPWLLVSLGPFLVEE